MKKTLLLSLLLTSINVFAVDPDFNTKTNIVTSPKVAVIVAKGETALYEKTEILLTPKGKWTIKKATHLDIEFTDADLKDIPEYDLSTKIMYFPRITINKNPKDLLTVDLLLPFGGLWSIDSFEPLAPTTGIKPK